MEWAINLVETWPAVTPCHLPQTEHFVSDFLLVHNTCGLSHRLQLWDQALRPDWAAWTTRLCAEEGLAAGRCLVCSEKAETKGLHHQKHVGRMRTLESKLYKMLLVKAPTADSTAPNLNDELVAEVEVLPLPRLPLWVALLHIPYGDHRD